MTALMVITAAHIFCVVEMARWRIGCMVALPISLLLLFIYISHHSSQLDDCKPKPTCCNRNKLDVGPSQCCIRIPNDVDRGLNMNRLLTSLHCRRPAESSPLRILQVGANSGGNANDHIYRFLIRGVATAILVEPVPWLFKKLVSAYRCARRSLRADRCQQC